MMLLLDRVNYYHLKVDFRVSTAAVVIYLKIDYYFSVSKRDGKVVVRLI